jgi:hypothetical protein
MLLVVGALEVGFIESHVVLFIEFNSILFEFLSGKSKVIDLLLLVSLHDVQLALVSFFELGEFKDSFIINFGSLRAVILFLNGSVSSLKLEELLGELLDAFLLGTQLSSFVDLLLLKSCNSEIVLSELLLASGF